MPRSREVLERAVARQLEEARGYEARAAMFRRHGLHDQAEEADQLADITYRWLGEDEDELTDMDIAELEAADEREWRHVV